MVREGLAKVRRIMFEIFGYLNNLGILEPTCLDSLVQLVGSPVKGWRLCRRERVGRQRRVTEWDDGS